MKIETFIKLCEESGTSINVHYSSKTPNLVDFIIGHRSDVVLPYKVTPEYIEGLSDEHIIERYIQSNV